MSDFVREIELQELIDKLRKNGYETFVDAFLLNEGKVYTKKSRLNKSGACRVLNYKPKQLDETILNCRKLLERDMLSPDEIKEEEEV